eukprot:4207398-Prymnesium_polylepis.1
MGRDVIHPIPPKGRWAEGRGGIHRRAEVVSIEGQRWFPPKGGDVTDPPWGGSNRMRAGFSEAGEAV